MHCAPKTVLRQAVENPDAFQQPAKACPRPIGRHCSEGFSRIDNVLACGFSGCRTDVCFLAFCRPYVVFQDGDEFVSHLVMGAAAGKIVEFPGIVLKIVQVVHDVFGA